VNIVVNTTHYYYGAIAAVKAAEDGGNGGDGERERERWRDRDRYRDTNRGVGDTRRERETEIQTERMCLSLKLHRLSRPQNFKIYRRTIIYYLNL